MSLNKSKIVVVGIGYVGLPLAILAKKRGYDVVGVDINENRINDINNKICPLADEKISIALQGFPIKATTDFSYVEDASTIIICVPTPVKSDHKPDLKPVISAFEEIGTYLKKGQLIILESTVNPGTIREVIIPILENKSKLSANKDFYIAHCPERINPGSKIWDVENIPRVIGSLNSVGLEKALRFYSSILKGEVKAMNSIEEAEAVKILENCFRDVNLALVNEFAMSFEKLGIDILHVIDGASTKPFSFLAHYPGCGVGGHCVPVDPYYMIDYARSKGFDHKLLSLAREINNNMPEYTVDLAVKALENNGINIAEANVALLGIAYKKNISDDRESPSLEVLKILKEKGINVRTYDPYVLQKSSSTSLDEVLQGADAVILATDHDEFMSLSPQKLLEYGVSILIDGRNSLNKDVFTKSGIYYQGIGR